MGEEQRRFAEQPGWRVEHQAACDRALAAVNAILSSADPRMMEVTDAVDEVMQHLRRLGYKNLNKPIRVSGSRWLWFHFRSETCLFTIYPDGRWAFEVDGRLVDRLKPVHVQAILAACAQIRAEITAQASRSRR